jgi:hypothetical protein
MIRSAKWNVRINLCSMVWPISVATLAGSSAAAGPDMPKPSLQLIHCSNGIRSGAKRRPNAGSFRPLVIDGGVRSVPGEHPWEAVLELFGLGLLAFYGSYLATLEANMAVLHGSHRSDSRIGP